jgi:hypothetical protein
MVCAPIRCICICASFCKSCHVVMSLLSTGTAVPVPVPKENKVEKTHGVRRSRAKFTRASQSRKCGVKCTRSTQSPDIGEREPGCHLLLQTWAWRAPNKAPPFRIIKKRSDHQERQVPHQVKPMDGAPFGHQIFSSRYPASLKFSGRHLL